MKISILLLGLVVLAFATANPVGSQVPQKKVADKAFLEKQKAVIHLLWGVTQPVTCTKILEIADSFHFEENLDHFSNVDAVKRFVAHYKYGTLPKEEVFTVFSEKHLRQAVALFNVFFYANDFETFYKAACWARVNFNSGQFVYAFTAAVFHREDFKGVVLPAPYEIFPHLFVDSEVIQQAYLVKFQKGPQKSDEPVVITVNGTGFYPYYQYNFDKPSSSKPNHNNFYDYNLNVHPENRLAYFTEDVAINTYNYYFHMYNPFYLNSSYSYKTEGRGELFLYYHQQIFARYFLERLSNDLLDVEALDFQRPIRYGYNPNLRYPNGKAFPARPDDVLISEYITFEYRMVEDFAQRIFEAIDFGYIFNEAGEKLSLYKADGIDYLGHIVESTSQSVHPKYYGKLFYYGMKVLGHIVDTHYNHDVAPGVMEHYETALRDPLYYRMLVCLTQLYYRYKEHLNMYQYEELAFPGVKVSGVEVDKLVTYFENFEFDISSAVATKGISDDVVVKAKQYRLTHKPFTYKVNIVSDKATNAMVRVFVGPKYDVEGKFLDFNEKRKFMVEVDRFPYQVAVGENVITRNSEDFFSTVPDQVSVSELYKAVKEALEGNSEFHYEEVDRHCGFPNRFLLPKGKRGGLPLSFFVAVTPLEGDLNSQSFDNKYHSTVGCGTGLGLFPQDGHAMGFPFDRPVDETQFFVPNFFEKDVIVFHKRADEIANSLI